MITLVDPQGDLMREIADDWMTRKDVALTYAFAMRSADDVDWPIVNQAIIERWSMAGLKFVKEQAWKLHEERSR